MNGESPDLSEQDEIARYAYPGARAPDRQRRVDSGGTSLAVYEWGDLDAPPVGEVRESIRSLLEEEVLRA